MRNFFVIYRYKLGGNQYGEYIITLKEKCVKLTSGFNMTVLYLKNHY